MMTPLAPQTDAPIRVLLIDDHAAFRAALAFVLDREPDIRVALQAGSVTEARRLLTVLTEPVDVAVIDPVLPNDLSTDLIRDLRRRRPFCQLVVLSGSRGPCAPVRASAIDAAAFLDTSVTLQEVIAAIRRAGDGAARRPPD
jgi:DNA-binding NarL/FixJ family response regulator